MLSQGKGYILKERPGGGGGALHSLVLCHGGFLSGTDLSILAVIPKAVSTKV